MEILANVDSGAYKFVLVLHVLTAIIGFGAVFLNGIYGYEAQKRRGHEGVAISEANYAASRVGTYSILGVLVLGILLVLLSDEVWDFGQTWIWLSILIFVVSLGLSHGLLMPMHRQAQVLAREVLSPASPVGTASERPPQVVELEGLEKRVAMIGTAFNLSLIAILFLMVWKPGL